MGECGAEREEARSSPRPPGARRGRPPSEAASGSSARALRPSGSPGPAAAGPARVGARGLACGPPGCRAASPAEEAERSLGRAPRTVRARPENRPGGEGPAPRGVRLPGRPACVPGDSWLRTVGDRRGVGARDRLRPAAALSPTGEETPRERRLCRAFRGERGGAPAVCTLCPAGLQAHPCPASLSSGKARERGWFPRQVEPSSRLLCPGAVPDPA